MKKQEIKETKGIEKERLTILLINALVLLEETYCEAKSLLGTKLQNELGISNEEYLCILAELMKLDAPAEETTKNARAERL